MGSVNFEKKWDFGSGVRGKTRFGAKMVFFGVFLVRFWGEAWFC